MDDFVGSPKPHAKRKLSALQRSSQARQRMRIIREEAHTLPVPTPPSHSKYAYSFKALSIFFAKLLDFKVWKKYILRNFCSQTGPTMCHGNNFNSKTIWSRKLKFWIC